MAHALSALAVPFAIQALLGIQAFAIQGGLASQGPAPATERPVDPAITRADVEACVRFLASDELKGRATGSAEAMRAGEFLAERLARAGVSPGGDDGSFLQKVPMTRARFANAPKLTAWDASGSATELVAGVDFVYGGGGMPSVRRLRIREVSEAGEMPGFADDEVALFLDGSRSDRRAWLGRGRGAGNGLVIVPGAETAGERPDERVPEEHLAHGSKGSWRPATLVANGKLLAGLRDGTIKAVRLEARVEIEEAPAANVVGVLRGAGTAEEPSLAAQAIVFSAHYDHIGHVVDPADPSVDTVFNGADDDASGCAAVLELAEAFAAAPKPARTLVFFFATGEEIGLVGTEHYLDHPLVPLDATVCNLNFEMIGRPDALAGGPGRLWLTGHERSNLGALFAGLGLSIVPDPRPDQRFFERSDNYAFAIRGIVAQTLSSYDLHKDYHRVTDEADKLDYEHLEAAVRAGFEAARALADGRVDPAWNAGGDPSRR
jgi:hypothetical protein